jgi:hypothetical protein
MRAGSDFGRLPVLGSGTGSRRRRLSSAETSGAEAATFARRGFFRLPHPSSSPGRRRARFGMTQSAAGAIIRNRATCCCALLAVRPRPGYHAQAGRLRLTDSMRGASLGARLRSQAACTWGSYKAPPAERGAARLAHQSGGLGVVGSNPAAPTNAAKEFPKAAKSRKTPVPRQCPG